VVRVPPIDRTELTVALSNITGEFGKCSILGSFIWISDTLETVRKIVSDLDEIRKKSERSYIAEVYFIRVNEEDFLKLTGDLRINSVDVFSSSFNVNELFEMFLDADGGIGSSSVDMRPILFLSEGRKAVFEVGSELTRERKAVNEKGIMETTGYEKFKDGVTLSLHLSRISEDRYSVDLDLEVSAFDKTDKNSPIPAKNNSVLKSPGLLAKDASVVYAGSLKRKDTAKLFGLVSLDASKKSEMITIWIRVREVK
jgi:hypothetical protein